MRKPPGIPGGTAGIGSIPMVNLDLNGQTLTILGSDRDDTLTFTPQGAQAGSVTRDGSCQVINFAAVGDPFTVDTGAGVDTLTLQGVNLPQDAPSSVSPQPCNPRRTPGTPCHQNAELFRDFRILGP